MSDIISIKILSRICIIIIIIIIISITCRETILVSELLRRRPCMLFSARIFC